MWKHLWAKQPIPPQYLDLLLCERFGVDILDADADKVFEFVICWQEESKVQNYEAKLAGKG